jgi:hypothetical protein
LLYQDKGEKHFCGSRLYLEFTESIDYIESTFRGAKKEIQEKLIK